MLREFLDFLRGDGEEPDEVDESYLSDLLRSIQPRVVEELDECPDHDPLPLIVAVLLGEVDRQRFGGEVGCPVTDPESPSLEGDSRRVPDTLTDTPPPAPPPLGRSDEGEDEGAQRDEAEGEESGPEGEEQPEREEDGPVEQDSETEGGESRGAASAPGEGEGETEAEADESPEEGDGDGGERSEAGGDGVSEDDGEANSDEADVAEEEGGEGGEAVEGADSDDTDEFFPEEGRETESSGDRPTTVERTASRVSDRAGRVVEESSPDSPQSVDSVPVLEMGRVFLGMLVENDALPVELQLTADEIDDARRLLYGYFLGDETVDDRARQMLRTVENKFDEGLFSQARILLKLFDADEQTRIENDRNLFYEEMILRFGIQRRHPVEEEVVEGFERRIDQYDGSAEELEEIFVWLSESVYVTFDLYGRNEREVQQWREIGQLSGRPGGADRLLEVIPPERWRLVDEFERSSTDLLEEQLTSEFLEQYVTEHVKTCYFILRAVGDTGLEPYLDVFFDWVDREFEVDGPALMPWLYTETTANERLIDDIFHELYAKHFHVEVESVREGWGRSEVEEAVDSVVERIGEADLGEIPPGHYDFGRFVLDELFGVEYPTEDFSFKMHRIT